MSEESTTPQQGPTGKSPSLPANNEAADNAAAAVVRFDWRTDPVESYSDWKIIVFADDKDQGAYHVHRGVLSARSKYFSRLFVNAGLQTRTSRIDMEDLAAEVFPIMLDYMYSLWDKDGGPITSQNAVVLHHLGRYFETPGLQEEAEAFWERGMNLDEAAIYLEHARIFRDERAYDAVVEACNRLISFVDVNSRLMELSDADFWVDVLKENKCEPNPALSTLISSFCCKSELVLEAATFHQLTDKSVLPKLSVTAAMELLQLERVFTPTPVSASKLSSLQRRGVEALISCSTMDTVVFQELQREFKDFPALVLSQMLQICIGKLLDCNKKLETTLTGTPEQIVVAGAALDAVNGTYTRSNRLREGAHYYVMVGNWNGSSAIFELYLSRSKDANEASYYISILKGLEPRAFENDNDFYVVPALKDTLLLPPKRGWIRVQRAGVARKRRPVPTLSYQV